MNNLPSPLQRKFSKIDKWVKDKDYHWFDNRKIHKFLNEPISFHQEFNNLIVEQFGDIDHIEFAALFWVMQTEGLMDLRAPPELIDHYNDIVDNIRAGTGNKRDMAELMNQCDKVVLLEKSRERLLKWLDKNQLTS